MIQIEKIDYRSWRNAYRLTNGIVDVIVLADVGPRVVHYGLCGSENQFHELSDQFGLRGGDEFRLYGGHRLWVWPETERTYFPDNQLVEVHTSPGGATFTAPVEAAAPGTSLQKKITIQLDESGTRVRLCHTVSNCGTQPTELAVWTPTVLRGGGCAILPFPPRAAMDKDHFQSVAPLALWSFTDFTDRRWVLGKDFLQLSHDDKPAGRFPEQMSGLFTPDGWGAYVRTGFVFLKRSAVLQEVRYPDFGCNFEVFTNPEFLELETLSPVVNLDSGEEAHHTERWWLFGGVEFNGTEASIHSAILPCVERTREQSGGCGTAWISPQSKK